MAGSIDIARVASEIFVFATSKYIRQSLGVYWVLVLSQMTGIARLWGYSQLNLQSSMAIPICFVLELLKGLSSGLITSSAVLIASHLAPAGCESTAQGLYSGMYSGLSMALGGIICGIYLWINQSNDPDASEEQEVAIVQSMFSLISIAALMATAALCFKFIFVDRVMGVPGFPRRHSHPHRV